MDPFVGLFIAAGAAAMLFRQKDYVVPGRRFHDSTKTAFYINTKAGNLVNPLVHVADYLVHHADCN